MRPVADLNSRLQIVLPWFCHLPGITYFIHYDSRCRLTTPERPSGTNRSLRPVISTALDRSARVVSTISPCLADPRYVSTTNSLPLHLPVLLSLVVCSQLPLVHWAQGQSHGRSWFPPITPLLFVAARFMIPRFPRRSLRLPHRSSCRPSVRWPGGECGRLSSEVPPRQRAGHPAWRAGTQLQ